MDPRLPVSVLKVFLSYPYFYTYFSSVQFQWFYSLTQAVTSEAENRDLLKRVLIK